MNLDQFQAALRAELEALDLENSVGADDRQPVELDQQSVGRLSRMDALQRQALAQATQRRRLARRARIKAALSRMEQGEFGYCQDCGELIPADRLKLDPTLSICIECAAGS
ncbi:MAG: TraR/DksA family transcriptional regulator [Boseongicola sp.]